MLDHGPHGPLVVTALGRGLVTARARWLIALSSVAFVAVVARIVGTVLAPQALYFPDSWCYVITRAVRPCPAHEPAINGFWRIFTLGSLTEAHVLWAQAILGVATALLVTWCLLRLCRWWLAMLTGMLFAILPLQIWLERSMLTETVETFFLALFLATACSAIRARRPAPILAWTAIAAASLGCAAAVHTAALLPAVTLVTALIVLVLWKSAAAVSSRLLSYVALPTLCIVSLVAPTIPTLVTYHRWYSMWTTDPAQASFLVTRWSPIVDCTPPPGAMGRTHHVLAVVCEQRTFLSPPGWNQDLLWRPPLGHWALALRSITPGEFAATQSQLLGAVERGIVAHPQAFLSQMWASIVFQMTATPVNDLRDFHDPTAKLPRSGPLVDSIRFPNRSSWFTLADETPHPHIDSSLRTLVAGTTQVPQLLLWTAMLIALLRAIFWALAEFRRRSEGVERPRLGRAPPSDRVSIAVLGSLLVVTSLLSVAFGTYPVFRYWSPLVPAILVLVALAIPPAATWPAPVTRTDEVPATVDAD